jgi:hypothetical protein
MKKLRSQINGREIKKVRIQINGREIKKLRSQINGREIKKFRSQINAHEIKKVRILDARQKRVFMFSLQMNSNHEEKRKETILFYELLTHLRKFLHINF